MTRLTAGKGKDEMRHGRGPCDEPPQLTFAEVLNEIEGVPAKPTRGREAYPLRQDVLTELSEFESALIRQGQIGAGSARTYRKALACVLKQAQRVLGRQLTHVAGFYEVQLISAVAADDRPFDGIVEQISKYTIRQRRVAMGSYLKAVGLPGKSFEEAWSVLHDGLRGAGTRTGNRYAIAIGRPERRRYRPPAEDVAKVVAVALAARRSFVGVRNAAAIVLAQHVGLRSHSLLAIDGTDFSWRHGDLFVLVKEKARLGRYEREVPPNAIP